MDKMLTKFESKSNRVKGLSFHSSRPWILTSLHNGQIQLWDYRMGTCLEKFEEHDGPVRGVDFHKSQSLIVSGGDDYKVKVWDYKLRRCLFTLLGHLDYIRTVQFHHEYPWIVSASDDQTIRIWNWQSRTCISVLTGHNHYVMCAAFHPKEDLIVSASLDQTVRVWDTSGLRKKTVRGAPPQIEDSNVVSRVNSELFGGNDAVVKYVLEGHERGVNWAAFHPTLPLIISGADDRQVKLWRMNETKAWEVDTMRGHTNNVSCVLFHPKHELIVSNSEDRTIRVWDISKRLGVQTFRRESDRFWILAVHPEQNILAAGHDSGMIVFKLERERPAFDCTGNRCFYVKDRYLRVHEFGSNRDMPLVSLRRPSTTNSPGIGGGPRTLHFNSLNKSENNVLIISDHDGGSYELITFSTDNSGSGDAQDVRRGNALSAVFIARDRFAVLDKSKQILVKNFQNEVVKKHSPTVANVDALFFAGSTGRVLLKTDEKVVLYDFQARKCISEILVPRVKYIFWNSDCSMVVFMSKHQVIIANKNLEQSCCIHETVKLKGGCWDSEKSIFVYATTNHIKYLLPSGDNGIIRGLEGPIYVVKACGNSLHCLDRESKMKLMEIDITEALFKIALETKDYSEVMRIVKHSRLCGQSIVSYLQEKGYPEVALHFVHDNRTKFKLALACGNIHVAMNAATELDNDAWLQLGQEALRQGNYEVVEMSYQKTKDFERLSFLYLLTGNLEKLKKMMKIAEMRNDLMSVVHNSFYLGDLEQRLKIMEATGQFSIAYLGAKKHGLENLEHFRSLLVANQLPIPEYGGEATLLLPPTPILREENWPQLLVRPSPLGNVNSSSDNKSGARETTIDEVEANWDDDELFDDEISRPIEVLSKDTKKNAWEDDDLDLSDDEGSNAKPNAFVDSVLVDIPTSGSSSTVGWCSQSSHCADHFASGSVDSGLSLLSRQIAATNTAGFKLLASSLFVGVQAYLPGAFLLPPSKQYLSKDSKIGGTVPLVSFPVSRLLDNMKSAYKHFSAAQFIECKRFLQTILQSIPLISVSTKSDSDDLKELVGICREYIIAVRIKEMIDDESIGISRAIELAAYFTHCNLQPSHLMLALKTAMAVAFKNKNFINAASFARRLLDFPDISTDKNADLKSKALKVLQKSEQQGRNEFSIDYDERNPFSIDCFSLKPIYKGSPMLYCPFCAAAYSTNYSGRVCLVCDISSVGVETVGLITQSTTKNKK